MVLVVVVIEYMDAAGVVGTRSFRVLTAVPGDVAEMRYVCPSSRAGTSKGHDCTIVINRQPPVAGIRTFIYGST